MTIPPDEETDAYEDAWADAECRTRDEVGPLAAEVIGENAGLAAMLLERVEELEARVAELEDDS